MAARKQLKGVAAGTATCFASRNVEIGGYWAVGILCRYAAEQGAKVLVIDVIGGATPQRLPELASRARARIERHLAALSLPASIVQSARVVLTWEMTESPPPRVQSAASTHYLCRAVLVDDRGREFVGETAGWCWPHDPAREMQSVRR